MTWKETGEYSLAGAVHEYEEPGQVINTVNKKRLLPERTQQ